jgi:hypothetical protein
VNVPASGSKVDALANWLFDESFVTSVAACASESGKSTEAASTREEIRRIKNTPF